MACLLLFNVLVFISIQQLLLLFITITIQQLVFISILVLVVAVVKLAGRGLACWDAGWFMVCAGLVGG